MLNNPCLENIYIIIVQTTVFKIYKKILRIWEDSLVGWVFDLHVKTWICSPDTLLKTGMGTKTKNISTWETERKVLEQNTIHCPEIASEVCWRKNHLKVFLRKCDINTYPPQRGSTEAKQYCFYLSPTQQMRVYWGYIQEYRGDIRRWMTQM